MDISLAIPFIKATIEVLTTMASMTPEAGKPFVKRGDTAQGDVTGMVGFTGDKNGTFSITFTKRCAVQLVKNMLGDDIQDILGDVKDAVGEVTNMISGQARKGLAEGGLKLAGSTPTVIMGDGHTVAHITRGPIMSVPFTTPHGDFFIEFCFE